MTEENRETAELFKSFRNMFVATLEPDYLNSAIPLAEQLSLSNPGLLPSLNSMRAMRDLIGNNPEVLSSFRDHIRNHPETLGSEQAVQDLISNRPEMDLGDSLRGGPPTQTIGSYQNLLERVEIIQTLHNTFEATGDIDYLDNAIGLAEDQVESAPFGMLRQHCLSLLTGLLETRCKHPGPVEVLDKAIRWMEVAVKEIPAGDPERAKRLEILSNAFFKRFKRHGAIGDLEQAIKRAEEAVAATPLDHPDRAVMLNNLGCKIGSRYDRLGDLQDLEQAIKRAEEAVAATPLDHPDRAGRLNNLGCRIGSRYDRLGDLQDLEQAIKQAEEAVAAAPLDHPDRAAMLNNLGNRTGSRYDRLGDLQDLEQAIKRAEEAVAATPLDHPDRAGRFSNLGGKIARGCSKSGDPENLKNAIEACEEAVTKIPPGHPNRAISLSTLISSLTLRYQETKSIQDFHSILRMSYEVWHCHISTPKVRIREAQRAGLLLASEKRWQESIPLLEGAIKMLPKVSPRSLGRGDQEHHLSEFTRLASEIFSIALQAGEEASHCLRLLELGRGIITGFSIDCRSDLSELELKQPEEFNKFHRLRMEVDSPLVMPEGESDGRAHQDKRHRRGQAVHELEETLNSIRGLPGFEGFQLPPRSDQLMAMASEGPIILFNSTEFRSDAIIVTHSAIRSLALPKLHYKSVQGHMGQIAKLVRGRRCTYKWRNDRMQEILLWLWNVAVEPVLGVLQLDKPRDDGDLPRVWWIGVGPLSIAPFHAAGDHSPGSERNTISRVISSYIPTIKALSFARQKKLELLNRSDSRLLLITMPTTPGKSTPGEKPQKSASPLKNATKEVEQIADTVRGKTLTTRLDRPSAAQVLEELPSYHAVHFACHGVSDSRSPSNSHLLLQKDDGSESGTLDELTVGAISNAKIKNAQIAYLSACCTAENASTKLADESIYIASGFQLAGFSHVLATQWISNDVACRQVAGEFYRLLFSDEVSSDNSHRKVSAAYHYAVKKLRDQNLRQPIKWACYIHTGA